MALLDVATFRMFFDNERINDLASQRDEAVGGLRYDETIITALISQAETHIKGALSKQYTTAEVEADASLQRMCGDLTMVYLELRRGTVPTGLQSIYDQHLARLERIRNGDEKLQAVAELLPSMIIKAPLGVELIENGYFDGIVDENEEVI